MRVHHLNCGTMCPFSARLVAGEGPLFGAARMVCHCLLVEHDDGLILVDTGLGTADIAQPKERLGGFFQHFARPALALAETALAQVEALGFRRDDVRHIAPTHLDVDHAGGLSDFPGATVHVHADEHAVALAPKTTSDKNRYRAAHLAHAPKWNVLRPGGERWFGFESVRAVGGTDDEVLLVPLTGHTRGHCGVAVRTDRGWLLHAGDAYFAQGEMDPVRPSCPPALAVFQRVLAFDDAARRENQRRLRELGASHGEVRIFSAHSPAELELLARENPTDGRKQTRAHRAVNALN